jgi:hypothetical protein
MANSRKAIIADSQKDPRELSRREFTVESLMALFAGVTITVTATGCGGDDGDDNPTGPDGSRSGAISANHGHSATVTSVQINAGNAVTLTLAGSDHTHTVDLTGAEVVQIGNGTRVSKASTANASAAFGTHDHTVTFN